MTLAIFILSLMTSTRSSAEQLVPDWVLGGCEMCVVMYKVSYGENPTPEQLQAVGKSSQAIHELSAFNTWMNRVERSMDSLPIPSTTEALDIDLRWEFRSDQFDPVKDLILLRLHAEELQTLSMGDQKLPLGSRWSECVQGLRSFLDAERSFSETSLLQRFMQNCENDENGSKSIECMIRESQQAKRANFYLEKQYRLLSVLIRNLSDLYHMTAGLPASSALDSGS